MLLPLLLLLHVCMVGEDKDRAVIKTVTRCYTTSHTSPTPHLGYCSRGKHAGKKIKFCCHLEPKLPCEFLERRALKTANYIQIADGQEWEIISSKSLAQASHPLPTCPGPTVWTWVNDQNNFLVKHGLN